MTTNSLLGYMEAKIGETKILPDIPEHEKNNEPRQATSFALSQTPYQNLSACHLRAL